MRLNTFILNALVIVCLIIISACLNQEPAALSNNVTEAVSLANSYKRAELEADLPAAPEEITVQEQAKRDKIRSLTTAAFFDAPGNSKGYSPAPRLSFLKQHNLRITFISFTQINISEASVELTYTGTLRFGNTASDKLTLEGTIQLIKTRGTWKVDNDTYNAADISGLLNHPS
ncbi:DUF4440 domain-containing protein [Paenibacillus typhae]|uniref:Uncharacterized protein n=1 Tax=Paenibacillus typhae TaxID=1174501 RepID=A0A1G8K7N4_9BACL|nr:hypothetical protein SAMN05216192_10560 [Paenibacillus typhae]